MRREPHRAPLKCAKGGDGWLHLNLLTLSLKTLPRGCIADRSTRWCVRIEIALDDWLVIA